MSKTDGDATPATQAAEGSASGSEDEQGPDATLSAAMWGVAAVTLVFAVLALVILGQSEAFGVFIGGSIATLNLIVFARIVQAFLAKNGRTAPWALIAIVKMFVLFGGVYLLVKNEIVSGVWLGAGYAAMPFGIVLGTFLAPAPSPTKAPRAAPKVPQTPTKPAD